MWRTRRNGVCPTRPTSADSARHTGVNPARPFRPWRAGRAVGGAGERGWMHLAQLPVRPALQPGFGRDVDGGGVADTAVAPGVRRTPGHHPGHGRPDTVHDKSGFRPPAEPSPEHGLTGCTRNSPGPNEIALIAHGRTRRSRSASSCQGEKLFAVVPHWCTYGGPDGAGPSNHR